MQARHIALTAGPGSRSPASVDALVARTAPSPPAPAPPAEAPAPEAHRPSAPLAEAGAGDPIEPLDAAVGTAAAAGARRVRRRGAGRAGRAARQAGRDGLPQRRRLRARAASSRSTTWRARMPRHGCGRCSRCRAGCSGRGRRCRADRRRTTPSATRPSSRWSPRSEPSQAAALYRRLYPLFQQAYAELGYPTGHFNDRLVEVVDHLLAAPEPTQPPAVQAHRGEGRGAVDTALGALRVRRSEARSAVVGAEDDGAHRHDERTAPEGLADGLPAGDRVAALEPASSGRTPRRGPSA